MTKPLHHRMKPLLLAVGLVTVVAVFSEVTVDGDLRDRNAELGRELDQMRAALTRLNAELDTIQTDIQRLRTTPEEALFQARTTLGLVRPGEAIYQVMPPTTASVKGGRRLQ